MKERPILMQADSVRGILSGKKTQTRRHAKLLDVSQLIELEGVIHFCAFEGNDPIPATLTCHYGQPGERLWVRETWALNVPPSGAIYRADEAHGGARNGFPGPWKPAIFMPRWACRVVLEIVKIRVERVQDITEADAIAEGVDTAFLDQGMYWQGGSAFTDERNPAFDPKRALTGPRGAYGMLWDKLNATRGCAWATNPWVWVIEFTRVKP